MKTFKLFFIAAIVASLFAACQRDNTPDIVINDNSVSTTTTTNTTGGNDSIPPPPTGCIEIGGTKIADLVLVADQCYILTEALIMTSGTTLTIPEGVVIRANLGNAAGSYIAIAQGAKIDARGTAQKPIVMTSNTNTPLAGDWGGLILLGKAPTNAAATGATSTSEIGNLPYGGGDNSDNSGVVKYVRIEYSGGAASGSAENNGFSFYGVGNGTTVDHIESYEGADDGAEFFGGTVNVSFLASVNNQDDSVDWTEGYSGTITDIYIKHGVVRNRALEGDGFNPEIGNNGGFLSNPTMSNISIIGLGSTSTGVTQANNFREGTKGTFNNMVIQGYSGGFKLDGNDTDRPTGQNILDGTLRVNGIVLTDVTTPISNNTGFTFTDDQFLFDIGNATGTDFATWGAGWARQ